MFFPKGLVSEPTDISCTAFIYSIQCSFTSFKHVSGILGWNKAKKPAWQKTGREWVPYILSTLMAVKRNVLPSLTRETRCLGLFPFQNSVKCTAQLRIVGNPDECGFLNPGERVLNTELPASWGENEKEKRPFRNH